MRNLVLAIVLSLTVVSGCARRKAATAQATGVPGGAPSGGQAPSQKLIVTPQSALVGKVAMVNAGARFVVLNFPVGHLPALEQQLSLYHRGLKVAEVKVT